MATPPLRSCILKMKWKWRIFNIVVNNKEIRNWVSNRFITVEHNKPHGQLIVVYFLYQVLLVFPSLFSLSLSLNFHFYLTSAIQLLLFIFICLSPRQVSNSFGDKDLTCLPGQEQHLLCSAQLYSLLEFAWERPVHVVAPWSQCNPAQREVGRDIRQIIQANRSNGHGENLYLACSANQSSHSDWKSPPYSLKYVYLLGRVM